MLTVWIIELFVRIDNLMGIHLYQLADNKTVAAAAAEAASDSHY